MKKWRIAGALLMIAFAAFNLAILHSSLTPYVNFAQAKNMGGIAQVYGVVVAQRITVTDNGRAVRFILKDESGEEVPVVYTGTKPDRLEQAARVVALGKYESDQFIAEKLLVKCPSKYKESAE